MRPGRNRPGKVAELEGERGVAAGFNEAGAESPRKYPTLGDGDPWPGDVLQ